MGSDMSDAHAEEATREASTDDGASPLVALARLAATGDNEATTKLLRVLAPRLVRIVRAVIGAGHPDVDDATQHALIGFVQALPAYRGDCDPLAYGRVIAVRAAIAARKRSKLAQSRREDAAETDAMPETGPSPGEVAHAEQRKDLLRDLLAELPSEQAEALALRIVLGCSLEEVADRTGVPLNTVRSRVRLAKERLKTRIEADTSLRDALEVTP
jgi:RNA polymerase sigma-70 factor, ECF subfamily